MWTNTAGLSGRKLQLAITFTSVMGFSLFGYDQGLMSGILNGEKFTDEFHVLKEESGSSSEVQAYNNHVSVLQGGTTASYEIGCIFGAVFTLLYGQAFGRTRSMFFGGIIIILGTVISTASFGPHWGLGQFIAGRVVTGVGNGMNTATIPVWQSEMSAAHNRGFLVCFEGAIIAVGTFVAYWVDFGLSYSNLSVQWRFPVSLQILFAALTSVGASMLPESPRWFIGKGLDDKALYVLGKLEGKDSPDEKAMHDFDIMKADHEAKLNSVSPWKQLFQFGKGAEFQRCIVGASGQFYQQFTGCNAAIYYSTLLFKKDLQLTGKLPLIIGGVFATVYALATIPSFWMVEHVGRRKLFMIGYLGQGLSFIITMACLAGKNGDDDKQTPKGAAVGLFLFICFFAFTLLPLPWIYPPEINPARTRTAGASIATCTNWVTNFAVVMFTPVFSSTSDWGIYLFFALMNFSALPVAWFYYPETAGRTLEEIDIIYARAHAEGKFAYQVANEMPKLTQDEILRLQIEYGLANSAQTSPAYSDNNSDRLERDLEKTTPTHLEDRDDADKSTPTRLQDRDAESPSA